MSNPNGAKGSRWERALRAFFRAAGIRAFKPYAEGRHDVGDLHGLSPFVGQAKNYRSWEDAIRLGLDGAEKQRAHAGEHYGVAFVKRARRSTGDGYAVMRVVTFTRLLLRLRMVEALLEDIDPDAASGYREAVEELNDTDFDALARANTSPDSGA